MGLWDCWVARMQLTANTQFVEGLRTCMSNIAIVSMPLNSSVLEKLDTVKIWTKKGKTKTSSLFVDKLTSGKDSSMKVWDLQVLIGGLKLKGDVSRSIVWPPCPALSCVCCSKERDARAAGTPDWFGYNWVHVTQLFTSSRFRLDTGYFDYFDSIHLSHVSPGWRSSPAAPTASEWPCGSWRRVSARICAIKLQVQIDMIIW